MNEPHLHIGLASWIIQDGNYGDFVTGSRSRFALEFYSEKRLLVVEGGLEMAELLHRHDAYYAARGIVRFVAADVWVVDFGGIMAFREEAPPTGIVPGVGVIGDLYLGIDPFFYFERLFGIPGMPHLIYEWQIEGIEIETAPFIESIDHLGRGVLVRDPAQLRRIPVARTDAWNDDSGNASYTLICRRMSSATFRYRDARTERGEDNERCG